MGWSRLTGGQQGWAVITPDRPAEKAAVLDRRVKLFAITSTEQLDKWRQLEIVMSRWRDIEALVDRPGPFIYRVTRTSVSRMLGPQD